MEAGLNGLHGQHAAKPAVVETHSDTDLATIQSQAMAEQTAKATTWKMRVATPKTATFALDHTYSDQLLAQEHAEILESRPSVLKLMTATTSAG